MRPERRIHDLIDQARVGREMRAAPNLTVLGELPQRIGPLKVTAFVARRWNNRVIVELTVADDEEWARLVHEQGAADVIDGKEVVTPEAARSAFSGCRLLLNLGDSEVLPNKAVFGGTGTERTAAWTFLLPPDHAARLSLKISGAAADTEVTLT